MQRDSAAVSARYQQAQELLASVRTQVLVASVLLRDALLDPDAHAQADHRQAIEKAYSGIDTLLMQYVPFLDSAAERERVGRLRAEIKEFRSASDEVLATDSTRWPSDARTLLRRFMPKREAAIRVSDEVQALNRAAFIDQQRALTEMQSAMQRQVWTVFGIALAISLVIGWLAAAARLVARAKADGTARCARSGFRETCSGCRRGWSRREKKSSGASRVSCTTRWARR